MFAANFLGQRLVRYLGARARPHPGREVDLLGVKQVSDTLFSPSGQAFRKALLVQFPQPGHVDDRVS